ncbi:HD domain-containing phosphohydrolase [Kordiimonas aquimaris]|uniref:HD domain-containing phosphohydrolase n=1 Tax=Kordiimonas aquimaris TaxID=707591 RepID=UPI0021CFD7E3|nr:HD domain-containing phosphohydrolase [Kordiimonas aquimaris]
MSQPAISFRNLAMPFIGIAIVISLVVFLIFKFVDGETEKGLENWQARMSLIADSRTAEVSEWLNRHLNSVEEIAGDASIQLYANTIIAANDPNSTEAQHGYIFSLLSAEAETAGFHEKSAIDTVAANVKRPNRAGLAVVNSEGRILVASAGMPMLRPEELSLTGARSFVKLGPTLADKTPLMLVGTPITMAENNLDVSAWLVGARPLDQDFLVTLVQPGDYSATAENYLVIAGEGQIVTPISPLKHGGKTGSARTDPAASFAARTPGGFGEYTNYDGRSVLVTGRELSTPVPWILVRTIETSEAFADINAQRNSLFITLLLAATALTVAMILIWRHGVSTRLAKSFEEQAALSGQNESLSVFLRAVSDNQPAAIAAMDTDMKARFVNKQMGVIAGLPATELENRRLDTIFDHETAELLRGKVERAATGVPDSIASVSTAIAKDRLFKTDILPLRSSGDTSAQVLLVMQEITDLVAANERSEALFHQLIGTLTQIIDARDPWSKHHSERVADVAAAIAQEMGCDEETCETMEIAGQLVNLGKIFVPIDILTKQTPLTDDELLMVRDSMRRGNNLLSGIEFTGPVAATLNQMREHWDGSGEPNGHKAEDIEPGARILSVANDFVGIVSTRAHRASLGFDKAIDILQAETGKRYERRVVAALQNILENKDGRNRWSSYIKMPDIDD